LAENGANIVINYTANENAANETINEIKSKGGNAIAVKADISKVKEIQYLFDKVIEIYGGIDICIVNAGIMKLSKIADTTEELFDELFAINTKGAFFTIKEAGKRLRDGGRIIAISSAATHRTTADPISIYRGTKAALEQFVRSAAWEFAAKTITVNTIAPGPTETDMLPPSIREWATSSSPLNRIGTVKDISDVVLWVCSEKSRWITGQTIFAAGGSVMNL